jgi:hypothetical protein
MFGAVMRARFPMATQQPAPTSVKVIWELNSRRKCDQANDSKALSVSSDKADRFHRNVSPSGLKR